jgi:NAD(P)-dependent dehydrogenase (short-subunit alcohol dehydrogenase family)
MKVAEKVVVVTGAASGIGKALAKRFILEGAEGLILADSNADLLARTMEELHAAAQTSPAVFRRGINLQPVPADVTKEEHVKAIVDSAMRVYGRIDLFCSNAGISRSDPDIDNAASAPNEHWELAWGVNVMAHVYAARHALPGMIARKSGYFLNTVSAAGLLSQIGSAVYSTSKHAAIGFGEHLAIASKENGIGVSLLCPQAVDTPMLGGAAGSQNVDGVLSPDDVAGAVVKGLDAETFLILPHEQVVTYMQRKTGDYDRWIRGMVRLRRGVIDGAKGSR